MFSKIGREHKKLQQKVSFSFSTKNSFLFPNLANKNSTNYTQTYITSVGKIHKGGDDFSRKCTPVFCTFFTV